MNEVFDENGMPLRLAEQFASGGQGTIHRLKGTDAHCVKLYHERLAERDVQKLKLLRSRAAALAKVAALPKSLAYADPKRTEVVGILLPFVRGHEIHELYGTRTRLHNFPKANFRFLIHAAYNLALVFEDLHRNGIIVADISEQNIKVLPDATVRLIDCDSFQVTEGDTIYTSDVGTPLWTPPELQGLDLKGYPRTENHDLFGLAQLIFLLFFAGRHPFAGVPRTARQLSPEAAIGEHAYVFAPEEKQSPLAPAPGCPPISAVPPEIQQLFLRAFLKGSEQPEARPKAGEWKECLESLLKNLTVCEQHSGHIYWKHAPVCPWCVVIREAEIDIFPYRDEHAADACTTTSKDAAYIARLRNLRPFVFSIQPPPRFDDLVPEPLPSAPSGLWSSLQRTVGIDSWKKNWLSAALETNEKSLGAAEAVLNTAMAAEQTAIAEYNQEFARIRTALMPILRLLSKPGQIQREIEAVLSGESRQFQLREFLEHLSLREAVIPGVGLGDKTVLQSHGIETAGDVTEQALAKIPGLGGAQISQLLAWRKTCEGCFKFDATKPISGLLRQEIERRVFQRLNELKGEAAACESRFNDAQRRASARLQLAQAQAAQAVRQRDQARLNIAFVQQKLAER